MRETPINLDTTINSGQVFLWNKTEEGWTGINGQDVLIVRHEPFKIISFSGRTDNFFREDDDLKKILQSVSKDPIVRSAVKRFNGLRLMRQDPFQCYISFICSSNSSIQNIKNTLQKLCGKFGTEIEFNKQRFFTFPTAEKLASVSIKDLLSCGLGFRAKYVKEAATAIHTGKLDFELLKIADYKYALEKLKTISGIGNKIADCILLFSLDKLEAFPIDRWTQRILQKYYSKIFRDKIKKILTEKNYENIHEKIVEYFGPYAGYSQQFLFKMERDLHKKKWL